MFAHFVVQLGSLHLRLMRYSDVCRVPRVNVYSSKPLIIMQRQRISAADLDLCLVVPHYWPNMYYHVPHYRPLSVLSD